MNPRTDTGAPQDASTAELLSRLSEQTSRLVRDEVALAKIELGEKVKHVGAGAGLFSAAGVLSLFGLGTVIAAAVLGLAEVIPAWLAAVVVAVVIFAIAGIAALVGRRQVAEGTPPMPQQTMENVRQDLATVREARHHEH